MVITNDWIGRHATTNKNGGTGWTREQLEALGVAWPPVQGWRRALCGQEIPDEQCQRFETLGAERRKKLARKIFQDGTL